MHERTRRKSQSPSQQPARSQICASHSTSAGFRTHATDTHKGDGTTFPEKGDVLTMHYTGWLAHSGSRFDSSIGSMLASLSTTPCFPFPLSAWLCQ